MHRCAGTLATGLIGGILLSGCELLGPELAVEVRASATIRPVYHGMVVLFQFYRNGDPVHRATPVLTRQGADAEYATRLAPGDRLGVTAAVYWNDGTEFVAVTDPESRELTYAAAREGSAAEGGGEPRYTWRVNLRLAYPEKKDKPDG